MDAIATRPAGDTAAKIAVPLVAAAMALPSVSSGMALLAGIALALLIGNPSPEGVRRLARACLATSVVGLGAAMDLRVVAHVGLHGLGATALGIAGALALGSAVGRRLGVPRDTSVLVSVGTAICGGSAIAAVAPSIGAKDCDVSVAFATVFLLNAVALFLFPVIGHRLHLGEEAFGLWCALAIHDTSSVVGAAAQYGARALEVATAAKLARALWIVPVTFVLAMRRERPTRCQTRSAGAARARIRPPWFIAGFLGTAAVVAMAPSLAPAGRVVVSAAHRLLTVSMFLVGLGLSRPTLRSVGPRPLLLAVALWFSLGGATLLAIRQGWIG
jgi:uncharacterized integral membrane protein (TIGR00698 family)